MPELNPFRSQIEDLTPEAMAARAGDTARETRERVREERDERRG